MFCCPVKRASRPPEKKNVTCGYFSVSAIRICFYPRPLGPHPSSLVLIVEDHVTFWEFFIVFRHRQVVQIICACSPRGNHAAQPRDFKYTSVRKLKQMTTSPFDVSIGARSIRHDDWVMNSSVTPAA
jgi:hypothetical protein